MNSSPHKSKALREETCNQMKNEYGSGTTEPFHKNVKNEM